MIADGSLNAKAMMLHGLLQGYITTTRDSLAHHVCGDVEDGVPDCYPGRRWLMKWLDRFSYGNDVEPELTRSLEKYLASEHCMCEHNDCRM